MKYDCRDIVVMGIVTLAWGAATVFLFKHPDVANFATWAGFAATITGVYHWTCYLDSKRPDA